MDGESPLRFFPTPTPFLVGAIGAAMVALVVIPLWETGISLIVGPSVTPETVASGQAIIETMGVFLRVIAYVFMGFFGVLFLLLLVPSIYGMSQGYSPTTAPVIVPEVGSALHALRHLPKHMASDASQVSLKTSHEAYAPVAGYRAEATRRLDIASEEDSYE
jgi:hypothetical protein